MANPSTKIVSTPTGHLACAHYDVSVIVPLYNKAPHIQRTLQSILNQTHSPLEIIVVDDGSTDGSAEKVRALDDPRIQLVCQDNAGPGAARNQGLALASAPYVAFLDADDEWMPTFLSHSVEQLGNHPDCAMTVMGQMRGPEKEDWGPQFERFGITTGVWQLPPDIAPSHYKPTLDMVLMGTMVCKREVLERFGGFYDKNHCTYGEDSYLWLQVLLNYPIYRDLTPLMWYHTEASDLAVWKRSICPPWAMLLDPEPIRDNCPPNYRNCLESLFANYTIIAAHRAATRGEMATIHTLLRRFPKAYEKWRKLVRIYLEGLVSSIPNARRTLQMLKRKAVNTVPTGIYHPDKQYPTAATNRSIRV